MVGKEQKQAVIYCRVSDAKQVRDGDGLNSQETRCREFAKRKNYIVAGVFKDDITGKLVDRPGMKAMLAFIRGHRTRGVVVIIDDISRLARGLQAHLECAARSQKPAALWNLHRSNSGKMPTPSWSSTFLPACPSIIGRRMASRLRTA